MAAAHMGGTASTVAQATRWWDEAEQLAQDAERLRTQVLGLARRAATHYGTSSVPAALAIDSAQMAAAGLLGLRRVLQAREQ